MTGNISLTAPMRSNLLSLQQISSLQDQTQLRLSTGLKVNSAIDNPSSYYTAQSLSNRADDLSALLDAMGQGVQTIKAATEGIEKAEDLITQMKAIAEQVSNGSYVPEKEYFIKEVGENGAVVSTAEELVDAVNSGKETICVYGKIDLGDISTSGGLKLQENQKLVGVNYFGNFAGGEGFSSISATSSAANKNLIDIYHTGCLVSDLSLNYENSIAVGNTYAVKSEGTGIVTDLQNLNIVAKFSDTNINSNSRGGIVALSGASTNVQGKINIEISGNRGLGIFVSNKSVTNINSEAQINIKTSGFNAYGIYTGNSSTSNIFTGANINIQTFGESGHGIFSSSSVSNIFAGTFVNIETFGKSGNGLVGSSNSSFNLHGVLSVKTHVTYGYGIVTSANYSGNHIFISQTAQIYLTTEAQGFFNGRNNGQGNNILEIASGAKIAFEKNGSTKWYEVKENYRDENTSTSTNNTISADNVETVMKVDTVNTWKTAAEVVAEKEDEEPNYILIQTDEIISYQKQYNSALSQYDTLIKDSAYKGINLLQEDSLKVNFNEDKSSHLMVQGVDVTSETIGLQSADWQTGKDVANSISQVLSAKDKLRSAATKLGNYYSIITERQTFTENLINVLTEGADKLTLADMNEESANMLSLQTRQSLAINSLSLASQANQAVLRLF